MREKISTIINPEKNCIPILEANSLQNNDLYIEDTVTEAS